MQTHLRFVRSLRGIVLSVIMIAALSAFAATAVQSDVASTFGCKTSSVGRDM